MDLEDKVEKIFVESLFLAMDLNYLETRLDALEACFQKVVQRLNEDHKAGP